MAQAMSCAVTSSMMDFKNLGIFDWVSPQDLKSIVAIVEKHPSSIKFNLSGSNSPYLIPICPLQDP